MLGIVEMTRGQSGKASAPCLRYEDARGDIRDGDIILFRGESSVSQIIRAITRSSYSHAGLATWWNKRLMVLEAAGTGVVARPLSRVVSHYNGKLELWTTDEALDREKVIESAKLELGKEYALWGLARILRSILIGVGKQPDPWSPPEKFVCSQYVSYAWRAGGIDLAQGAADEFTTPEHIAKAPQLRQVGRLSVEGLLGRPAA